MLADKCAKTCRLGLKHLIAQCRTLQGTFPAAATRQAKRQRIETALEKRLFYTAFSLLRCSTDAPHAAAARIVCPGLCRAPPLPKQRRGAAAAEAAHVTP